MYDWQLIGEWSHCILRLYEGLRSRGSLTSTLIDKLRVLGFSHSSLLWLSSTNLDGREHVRDPCTKETSRKRTILSRVSQGSVLGSLLFVLYLRDFSSALKHCRYNFYANDLLMYLHSDPKQLGEAILKVNEDITNIT